MVGGGSLNYRATPMGRAKGSEEGICNATGVALSLGTIGGSSFWVLEYRQ